MLAYYAERFPTVEINYTFYRMPTEKLLAGWAAGTPEQFTFTLKAPRRITHDAKLQRCEDLTQTFCRTAQTLGPKLGGAAVSAAADLQEGCRGVARLHRGAAGWHASRVRIPPPVVVRRRVFDMLRARNLALCVADSEKLSAPVEITADYAYFRLRDEGYQQADIERWAGVIRGLSAASARMSTSSTKSRGLGRSLRSG